jgi:hypothetical protein
VAAERKGRPANPPPVLTQRGPLVRLSARLEGGAHPALRCRPLARPESPGGLKIAGPCPGDLEPGKRLGRLAGRVNALGPFAWLAKPAPSSFR